MLLAPFKGIEAASSGASAQRWPFSFPAGNGVLAILATPMKG